MARPGNQLEEAIKCFTEAARLAPNDQDALVNRGNCYMQIGDIENAILSYEMVLQADESSVIAWYVLRSSGSPSTLSHPPHPLFGRGRLLGVLQEERICNELAHKGRLCFVS